jgi:hypothetical protein
MTWRANRSDYVTDFWMETSMDRSDYDAKDQKDQI